MNAAQERAEATPLPIQRQAKKRNHPTVPRKLQTYQEAIRELRGSLRSSDFRVLMIVVDNTVGWGRPHVKMTRKELATGCNLSKRTVTRAVARLAELGLIVVQYTGAGSRYAVTDKLRIPKRIRDRSGQRDHSEWPKRPTPINTSDRDSLPIKRVSETLDRAPPREAPGGQTVQGAAERVTEAAARRTERRALTATMPSLWESWRLAHQVAGFQERQWTPQERGMMRTLCDWWPGSDPAGLHRLLNDAVERWTDLMRDHFNWMDSAPMYPRVSFLVRHREKFRTILVREGAKDATDDKTERYRELMARGKVSEAMAVLRGRDGKGA